MSKVARVTLTKTEAASAYGQRLIHQIMAVSDDGDLTIEEVRALHAVLMDGPAEINAVPFLRARTTSIISDGELDQFEMYDLRRAMERVVPKSVRINLTILLSRIGLPTLDEDDDPAERSWHDDPITARQLQFIRDLGGVASEWMTKGQASALIDELLERRPPSPRQQMLLRFFDRLDLMDATKEEVSVWVDELYAQHEDYERAWHVFKTEIGDDGTLRDPAAVPVGAYRGYIHDKRREADLFQTRIRRRKTSPYGPILVLVAVLGAILTVLAIWLSNQPR